MQDWQKRAIDSIAARIIVTEYLSNYLVVNDLLTQEEWENVTSANCSADKSTILEHVKSKGDDAYYVFRKALLKIERKDLYDELPEYDPSLRSVDISCEYKTHT